MEQFTYVKRGYDPEEVDKYISTLEQVIKSYKEKDNAIKNAIISAQVAADNMVKNAKAQADEYKTQIARELDKVSLEVDRQRMKIQAFQDVYAGLVRKYLTEIDEKEISDLYSRLDDVDKLVERLKEVDIMPAPTPGEMPPPAPAFQSGVPNNMSTMPPPPSGVPHSASHGAHDGLRNAPLPPKPPAPQISLGSNSSPSLNKNLPPGGMPGGMPPKGGGYAPPQVVAKINDDGNYVPSS